MKQRLLLIIIFAYLFTLSSPAMASNSLVINHKSFTITSIKTKLKISGIDTNNNQPVIYTVKLNDVIATSGVSLASNLSELPIVFSESGNTKISITIGKQKGESKIRTISGWMSILPPFIAIVLALITREVLSSLFVGVWLGATIISGFNPIIGFLRSLDTYLLNSLADPGHASIVIFCAALGGMVGVINRTGGMQGIVTLILSKVKGPRSAQFATWLMGVLIFFDDYANTLIVGNSMRPVTDKNGISREKLSYLVDSTAAPVAGIAVLSTWIGYEIGLIRQAYMDLGLFETNFYGVFIQTIPFRFYCLLALFFGLIISLTGKDFGPMLTAEKRSHNEGKPLSDDAKPISSPESAMPELPEGMPKRWYNAAIPIIFVILGTFIGLLGDGGMFAPHYDISAASSVKIEGYSELKVTNTKPDINLIIASTDSNDYVKCFLPTTVIFNNLSDIAAREKLEALPPGTKIYVKIVPTTVSLATKLRAAFSDADSARVLIWVSIIGSIIAILLGLIQGLITVGDGVSAWTNGVRSIVMAICIILLAWSINGICRDLSTANFIVEMVTGVVPYWLLPSIIFILACLISFSTGTSWGTMAILLPISIPLAYHLNLKHYKDVISIAPNAPSMLIYLKGMILVSIGAVLEGSIFGDHCSPISDTTIMSSMTAGSDHIDHVRTQTPYALIVGLVSIFICYIPAGCGVSPLILTPLAMIILALFIVFVGKKANGDAEDAKKSSL